MAQGDVPGDREPATWEQLDRRTRRELWTAKRDPENAREVRAALDHAQRLRESWFTVLREVAAEVIGVTVGAFAFSWFFRDQLTGGPFLYAAVVGAVSLVVGLVAMRSRATRLRDNALRVRERIERGASGGGNRRSRTA